MEYTRERNAATYRLQGSSLGKYIRQLEVCRSGDYHTLTDTILEGISLSVSILQPRNVLLVITLVMRQVKESPRVATIEYSLSNEGIYLLVSV